MAYTYIYIYVHNLYIYVHNLWHGRLHSNDIIIIFINRFFLTLIFMDFSKFTIFFLYLYFYLFLFDIYVLFFFDFIQPQQPVDAGAYSFNGLVMYLYLLLYLLTVAVQTICSLIIFMYLFIFFFLTFLNIFSAYLVANYNFNCCYSYTHIFSILTIVIAANVASRSVASH